ncbi:MAG: pseudouridine synthase [Patescibacteria group bacterium]|nr:pseudouridine synthase [Patescibacteria group bacterium]
MKIRLQKFLSQAGCCSRRQAEELIQQKRIKINNQVARLGDKAEINKDEVRFDERVIKLTSNLIYIKLNKPRGYTCTHGKFEKEKNIFELINLKEKLLIVGRLDRESRGLVLLTTDGELMQQITHPSYRHEKEYIVKISQKITEEEIKNLIRVFRAGLDLGPDFGKVRVKNIEYLKQSQFKIILIQGKKRQIRQMFQKLNYQVADLQRIRIKNIKLEKLAEGKWQYLTQTEINNLKK